MRNQYENDIIPSLPTVAKHAPSVENVMLLIEPWQICHLAIGLHCIYFIVSQELIGASQSI